jgi:photosystem II stability/assembly factor-like uncharacterized protein
MIPCDLLLGTADGLRRVRIDESGTPEIVARNLFGQAVRGIATDPENQDVIYIAAGLRGYGLYRSIDGGQSVESFGFDDYWCWDVAIDPGNTQRVLVGTEPPMLWESRDRGTTWRDFPTIDQVESRPNWTFFHAPFHSGHLHGIALSSERPGRIVVGVEHGALLISGDGGRCWTDVMPGADLHRVEVAPDDPDRLYAGAGHGLFVSGDGGWTWAPVEDLRGKYIHGIEIDPANPDRMFVYVDSRMCPVYRSTDRGETWTAVGKGLPTSRPADPLSLHPDSSDVLFYTGDWENGSTLYISEDNGDTWWDSQLELPKVWRMKTL